MWKKTGVWAPREARTGDAPRNVESLPSMATLDLLTQPPVSRLSENKSEASARFSDEKTKTKDTREGQISDQESTSKEASTVTMTVRQQFWGQHTCVFKMVFLHQDTIDNVKAKITKNNLPFLKATRSTLLQFPDPPLVHCLPECWRST